MSAKRSIFATASGNNLGTPGVETVEYYRPSYIQPKRPAAENGSAEANGSTENGSLHKTQEYPFKILSWVRSSKPYTQPDCDEQEVLDIGELLAQKEEASRKVEQAAQTKKQQEVSGLSAADIRGAVGVEEGISGLSASNNGVEAEHQKESKKEESQIEESASEEPKKEDEDVEMKE